MKDLGVTKIVKKIKFEKTWSELETKSCFQSQLFTKYLRQFLVFMWNSEILECFSFLLVSTKLLFWEEN